ncbi:VOC family protein [Flavobacterium psychroterrae]|uniref:VOC family protein n=1 Tax=Flavobacterium psychroterrae TaxID=2133767 RepID=A0ABS5PEB7_9FLAO|nr:VOC family protein [Flavobacterium psychroterrae]MBS7232629.1 VOC family protein [Flavobacterium psychroterrae]
MENTSLNKNGLASFSLYNVAFTVADLDASIEWYKSIFGFDLVSRVTFTIPTGSAETAIIKAGELRLELLQVPNSKRIEALFAEAPQHLDTIGNKSIVLQVNDLAAASQELEEKGVTFVWRELYIAGDKMLCTMIQDVDGNKINIFQTNTIIGN